MPVELEAPAAPVESQVPASTPAPIPVATEPEVNLDTAFSDAAAAQRTTLPASPAPQAPVPGTPVTTAAQPAAPAAPPAAPAGPSISPSLLTRAQAANLPLDGIKSDAELAQALFDHLQQVNPYVQLGRQQLAQQQPAAPAQPEWTLDNYFAERWQVPEWKPEYQFAVEKGMVTQDANGNLVPAPGFDAMVLPLLGGMNAALAARQEQQARLFSEGNPLKNIYEAIEEPLVRKFEQMLEQRFSGYTQTQQQHGLVDKFEQDNAAWLYGQDGQPTQQGSAFIAAVQELKADGITDPQRLLALGMKLAGINPQAPAAPATPAAAPAAPAAPQAERPRRPDGTFMTAAEAAAAPPAPPTAPAAPQPTAQESFLDSARKRAGHSPSRQGHEGANPDDPVDLRQGDLENYFTNAYRQAAGAN
jgi:hypothetical protein